MKLLFTLLVLLYPYYSESTILPENNLTLPSSDKSEGLGREQYDLVINKMEQFYRPYLEKRGITLTINRLWDDPRVNAGTTKKGKEIIINLYGGYARHPLVTEDAYALVLCHELGHHLGGTPRKIFEDGTVGWPATEGQADYFATLKCLRKIFSQDDNITIVSKLKVPDVVYEKCQRGFKSEWEKALCIRTSLAGLFTSYISASVRRDLRPSFETPDQTTVDVTFDEHPAPQCRLDTYFQGSICEVSSYISISDADESKGTCHAKNGHHDGRRPMCWFKPQE